jgi:hypothetical protein
MHCFISILWLVRGTKPLKCEKTPTEGRRAVCCVNGTELLCPFFPQQWKGAQTQNCPGVGRSLESSAQGSCTLHEWSESSQTGLGVVHIRVCSLALNLAGKMEFHSYPSAVPGGCATSGGHSISESFPLPRSLSPRCLWPLQVSGRQAGFLTGSEQLQRAGCYLKLPHCTHMVKFS